jgi:ribosomal protein S14
MRKMIRNKFKLEKIFLLKKYFKVYECERLLFLIYKKNYKFFKKAFFFKFFFLKKKRVFLSRIKSSCLKTNNTRWVLKFFNLSRMRLKIDISKGLLYGVKQRVW